MRRRRWAVAAVVTLAAGVVGTSCGSSDSDGGGASASGGNGGKSGADGGTVMDVNTSSDAPYDGPICGGDTFTGQTWPLDLFVMMDQSGSMVAKIDQAKTISKWQAVTTGLSSYFQAEASAGDNIGVGIQFFPLPVVAVDSLPKCATTADCSGANMCLTTGELKACVKPCSSSAECGGAECVDAGAKICANDSCTAANYATPEVAIGPVSSTKDAVLSAMGNHHPMMYTPTGPALEGALQYAKGYQQGHPDRKVIVVLATDGQPTECPSTDTEQALADKVKGIAAAGLAGTPSVRTFVVGVVTFGEDAQVITNLHAIAAAGGTTEALIAEPKEDLAKAFSDALLKITGEALSCDYKIPLTDGGKPDFAKVNLVIKINGGADQVVYHVQDASKCDPALGGWYYDPPTGEPEHIKLCAATCAALNKSGQTVEVGFEIGCATQNMPPK
jgi:hypothetical protein